MKTECLYRAVRGAALCGAMLVVTVSSSFALAQAPAAAQYDQPFRPQVHFSPQRNWTNDPNGLVYFEGEYHLFYQYNPFGDEWGHMSWGHAVSRDLLHWHELPVAIPEADGVMIFTGSVVVDKANSSGLCKPGQPCLVAVYTGDGNTPEGHRETQNLAYSLDKGRTWTKYKANPVLDLHMVDFRDPSVFRDEERHRWLMSVSLPKEHKVRFYSSPDLKQWSQLSDFGPAGDVDGDWECPDLLQIPAAQGKGSIWALKVGLNPGAPQGGSGEQYFLGSFDGTTFTSSNNPGAHGWTNYGKDDYCAISYNGLPQGAEPVLIGWMSNWQYAAKLPTAPWRGQMSLPRRLSYLDDKAGLALVQQPVVAPLHETATGGPLSARAVEAPFEVEMTFDRPSAKVFGLKVYSDEQHYTEVGFDTEKNVFYIDRSKAGPMLADTFTGRTTAPLVAGRPYDLKLVLDRSSVEAYAQEGTIAMTDLIFPNSQTSKIRSFPAEDSKARVWELNSVWQAASKGTK